MPTVGIVAEYNPFHTGHAFQIAQTRRLVGKDAGVVCVMSGNWVQGADPAVADKWTRAALALLGGADLVLELPTVWAVSSAETFAGGAVELLAATGVVDALSFGSECGDVAALKRAADCLDGAAYREELRRRLEGGASFALCRREAVKAVAGEETAALLDKPNNNLGVEYLRALDRLGSRITPVTVLRRGAGHGGVLAAAGPDGAWSGPAAMELPPFVSATDLRCWLAEGRWDLAEPYLVPGEAELLRKAAMPDGAALAGLERAFLARFRTMTAQDWAALPDSAAGEGLPQRLERAGREAASMEEFWTLAKTRRYTHARIRRLALWAFLGLIAADRPAHPPYLRVLGLNGRGQALLREMKGRASLPILSKSAHAKELDEAGRRLFELENRCTDLYGLCFQPPLPAGKEWTWGPVVKK